MKAIDTVSNSNEEHDIEIMLYLSQTQLTLFKSKMLKYNTRNSSWNVYLILTLLVGKRSAGIEATIFS